MRLVVPAIFVLMSLAVWSLEAEAKSYKWNCAYTKYASPEGLKSASDFKMEFIFDDITGKAVMIGNLGLADVDIHRGNSSLTFMEKLNGGVVQTTTVANDGSSVHSRHSVVGKEMVPSQYYGRCAMQ